MEPKSRPHTPTRIVHVIFGSARHQSRMLKEATSAIRAGLGPRVSVIAGWEEGDPENGEIGQGIPVTRVRLRSRGLKRGRLTALVRLGEARLRFARAIVLARPTLIHCHSLYPLPACTLAARWLRVPVLYDAHELETERCGLNGALQRYDRWRERRLIRRVDTVVCVGDAIADWYARHHRIPRPLVVRNIPDARLVHGPRDRQVLRDRFGLAHDAWVFMYQGAFFEGRRIEQMIRVFERARSDRHLVCMGYGPLEPMIRDAAARCRRIHLLPAVAPTEVLSQTAGADVGICGVANACLSYYLSLPNKLFEYLEAGVPCAVPDFPEMEAVVQRHGCGWVIGESDDDWLAAIDGMTRPGLEEARRAVAKTAPLYSWLNEERVLLEAYARLGASSRGGA